METSLINGIGAYTKKKTSLINGRSDPQLADALTKVSPRGAEEDHAPRPRNSRRCSSTRCFRR